MPLNVVKFITHIIFKSNLQEIIVQRKNCVKNNAFVYILIINSKKIHAKIQIKNWGLNFEIFIQSIIFWFISLIDYIYKNLFNILYHFYTNSYLIFLRPKFFYWHEYSNDIIRLRIFSILIQRRVHDRSKKICGFATLLGIYEAEYVITSGAGHFRPAVRHLFYNAGFRKSPK